MRRTWLLIGIALAVGLLAVGAACGSSKNKTQTTPTATVERTVPAGATATAATTPSGTTTGVASTVNVTLLEFKVSPNATSVPAGDVTFNVRNIGTSQHEFLVIKTGLAEDALPTKADGSVDESGAGIEVVGKTSKLTTGMSETDSFTLQPGKYVLICNLVDSSGAHYHLAMHKSLEVTP